MHLSALLFSAGRFRDGFGASITRVLGVAGNSLAKRPSSQ